MSVVLVKVKGRGSQNVVTTYALLDSGSTGTFCSELLLEQLDIKGKKCKRSVSTIGNVVANCETPISCLEVMNLDEDVCFEIPNVFSAKSLNISRTTVERQEDVDRWQHLKGIKLTREIPNGEVTLLIGIDVPEALQPHDVCKSENGGPYAIQTVFGWTLNGPRKVALYRRPIMKKTCLFAQTAVSDALSEQLKRYFSYDFSESLVDSNKMMSVVDKKALSVFEDSVQLIEGHYQISIPWKNKNPNLPNNRSMAERRLGYLKKKLEKDPSLKKRYSEFIEDLVERGYARKVANDIPGTEDGKVWYLPHHNVVHPKKPDKVRVVFDCAAKYHGVSLNDNILQGPDLTNNLIGVLCRFRQYPVALMADIEAMFHQVRVNLEDPNALRFLWWPNGDLSLQPVDYQM